MSINPITSIFKEKNIITLKNSEPNEAIDGIISKIEYKPDETLDEDGSLIDDYFERSLFLGNGGNGVTYDDITSNRIENLSEGDRVLVYKETLDIPDDKYKATNTKFAIGNSNNSSNIVTYDTYKRETYTDNENADWHKATFVQPTDENNNILVRFDDENDEIEVSHENIRKLNPITDINIMIVYTINDAQLTIKQIEIKNGKIIVKDTDDNTYSIETQANPASIETIQKLEQNMMKQKSKVKTKTKYTFKWFYKTNYSGSKYFPLKILNVETLSEANKYAEVDKYTELKQGDIVKYNDPNHSNHNLLAKITGVKEDPLNKRNYYDRKKYLYTIRFEPLETYIEPSELNEYKQKYGDMIDALDNVNTKKLLKFRFVEKEHYDESIETILNTKDKLKEFNNIISQNTLAKLKKNDKFILDYILSKHQPESGVKDMNQLIKQNNKNVYIISHSPTIKKRKSGQFFDIKIKDINKKTKRKNVEIDIYVDLILFQSKTITEEEWNDTSLAKKLGTILTEQVKNSYAGVLNCPSRFDKLKTIMNHLKKKRFFVDPDESETNLIKQTFNQTSKKIKVKKEEIEKIEEEMKELEKKITGAGAEKSVDEQIELGKKQNSIAKLKRELVELESVLKQKGGRKTRRKRQSIKTYKNKKMTRKKSNYLSKKRKTKKHKSY